MNNLKPAIESNIKPLIANSMQQSADEGNIELNLPSNPSNIISVLSDTQKSKYIKNFVQSILNSLSSLDSEKLNQIQEQLQNIQSNPNELDSAVGNLVNLLRSGRQKKSVS
jgi:hypothetical protein